MKITSLFPLLGILCFSWQASANMITINFEGYVERAYTGGANLTCTVEGLFCVNDRFEGSITFSEPTTYSGIRFDNFVGVTHEFTDSNFDLDIRFNNTTDAQFSLAGAVRNMWLTDHASSERATLEIFVENADRQMSLDSSNSSVLENSINTFDYLFSSIRFEQLLPIVYDSNGVPVIPDGWNCAGTSQCTTDGFLFGKDTDSSGGISGGAAQADEYFYTRFDRLSASVLSSTPATSIPEPQAMTLMAMTLGLLFSKRSRRQKRDVAA